MATLYDHIDSNIRKTWFLLFLFFVLIVGLGYFLGQYYGSPFILYFALIFSLIMNVSAYWYSDKIVMKLSGARELSRAEDQEIFRLVENLSITAGMPIPKIYLIDDPSPNAFATGRNKEHGAIAITSGLRGLLNKTEMEGVIAHELAHIRNHDTLIATVVVVLVGLIGIVADIFLRGHIFHGNRNNDRGGGPMMILGIILIILSPIIATIIQLAISRKREFLADASASILTRYPEGLANALKKISSSNLPLKKAHNTTAHLFISNPFSSKKIGSGFSKLFMTHPPIEERIKALLGEERDDF